MSRARSLSQQDMSFLKTLCQASLGSLGFVGFFEDYIHDAEDHIAFLLPRAEFEKRSVVLEAFLTYLIHQAGRRCRTLEWRASDEYDVDHYGSRFRTLVFGPHIFIELGDPVGDPVQPIIPNLGLTKSWTIQSVDVDCIKGPAHKYIRFDSVCYEAAYSEDVEVVIERLVQTAQLIVSSMMM